MRRVIVLLIGLAISVVALYYALSGFRLDDVWDALGRMQLVFFLPMIIPYVLTFMTKVWRWRVLLHSDNPRLTNWLLFSALMISYIPFPFRAGEVARGAGGASGPRGPPACAPGWAAAPGRAERGPRPGRPLPAPWPSLATQVAG